VVPSVHQSARQPHRGGRRAGAAQGKSLPVRGRLPRYRRVDDTSVIVATAQWQWQWSSGLGTRNGEGKRCDRLARREYMSPSVSGGPTGLFGGAATVRRHQKEGRGREPKANSFWLAEVCGRLQPWGALGTSRLHRTLWFFPSSRLQGTRGRARKSNTRTDQGGGGKEDGRPLLLSQCVLYKQREVRACNGQRHARGMWLEWCCDGWKREEKSASQQLQRGDEERSGRWGPTR
jgi:hypothetical protein